MNNLPQQPRFTKSPASTWLRNIRSNVQRNQITVGGDITAVESPHGIRIKNKKEDGFFERWRDLFEPSASYRTGDEVFVDESKQYYGKDYLGATVDYISYAGVYVCTFPVPVQLNLPDFNLADQYIYNFASASNTRTEGVIYAPIFPHPDYAPDDLPTNEVQGKYWHLKGFAAKIVNQCDSNGGYNTYYVEMAQSGSISGSLA
jgi:hypothetical protein